MKTWGIGSQTDAIDVYQLAQTRQTSFVNLHQMMAAGEKVTEFKTLTCDNQIQQQDCGLPFG